jgi:uncharacterized protein DUF3175
MKRKSSRGWVRHVQQTSNAMDIPDGLFTRSPRRIALGLKRSVTASNRTKGTQFQSAMSMLNWFINRGGRGLPAARRRALERAKIELRDVFGRGRRVSSNRGRRRA